MDKFERSDTATDPSSVSVFENHTIIQCFFTLLLVNCF